MTPEEAIKILYRWRNGDYQIYDDVLQKAIALGIEALKERQEAISQGLPLWHELLPGETKE